MGLVTPRLKIVLIVAMMIFTLASLMQSCSDGSVNTDLSTASAVQE